MGGIDLIARNPEAATEGRYDLTVLGGGVYGIALCLEASRQGLKTLLVERNDFGGETSWNSLRILHGGLRYLQTMDLARFRESIAARREWIRTYPELVTGLPCVMPLYGQGLKRPGVLRLALAANRLLSANRNRGVREDRRLAAGTVVSQAELRRLFPSLDLGGAKAGALWYDAMMPSSERILMEMLRWAAACGATSLNYVEADRLASDGSRVSGVICRDRKTGKELRFSTRAVVSCVGPWTRRLLGKSTEHTADLFRPSLALNLLLDRESLGEAAIAVTAKGSKAKAFFLCPWQGRILAGTFHTALPEDPQDDLTQIRERSVQHFLDQLNNALPELQLTDDAVLLVQAGQLPAKSNGSTELANRPVFLHLGGLDAPSGLFALSGVKFTTARQVAEQTLRELRRYLGQLQPTHPNIARPEVRRVPSWGEFSAQSQADAERSRQMLLDIVREESVQSLEDLMLRRTAWWATTPGELQTRTRKVSQLLGPELP